MVIPLKFIEIDLKGAYVIELEAHRDERGLFARTYCQSEFAHVAAERQIVQINHSLTYSKGTVRGMHYQVPPAAEAKLIRCIAGKVYDVVVDLRKGSPTFLKWRGVELSKDNMRMIYVPEGFAHGFQTLEDGCELIYHHTACYEPDWERGLRYDDPLLDIHFPLEVNLVSEKDASYPFLTENFRGVA